MTEDFVPPTKRIRPSDVATRVTPTETLYLNNLNDKIKKPDLKTALYMLFSTYGQVISIIALKTPKMRGQAHVVFNSTAEASAALKALQDFELFDKPVRIAYAKSKSDVIAKRDGTFKLRPPPPSNVPGLPPATVQTTIAAFDSSDDERTLTAKRKREDEGAVTYANDSSSNDEDDDDNRDEN